MTQKKENILKAALRLFAEQGYYATSTSKIAKEAGVSEGLIFRHFGNKEKLFSVVGNPAHMPEGRDGNGSDTFVAFGGNINLKY